jgi:alkylhydroperoxidase/carboxymuconolactone decarboxylase family protein YurZ
MVGSAQELLRRLTDGEEDSIRAVLALRPEPIGSAGRLPAALPPRIRMLVCLAALVAVDASTPTMRWAVELASAAGVGDDELVDVLMIVGADVGIPRVISAAPRLALAIGYDIEAPGAAVQLPRSPALEARATASDREAASSLR